MMNNPMMRGNPMIAQFSQAAQQMQNSAKQNPMFQIAQAMRNGQDPMPIMQNIAKQNPIFNRPLEMIDGKSIASQKQTAFNMAKEYGLDLSRFASMFGLSLPNN